MRAAPSFTPVLPPSYPLAVRNPYLSAWLPGNQTANLPYAVPQFWNGQNLTWSVITRVDGQAYILFGVPSPGSEVKPGSNESADYSSTHTTFVVTAGPTSFTLDFLSPISPQDYVRQSLPFSYLTISASGLDGATPSVQLYSDIDNSWAGQYGEDVATSWGYALSTDDTQVFTLTADGAYNYSEVNDMAQWGTAVYCTRPNSSNITVKVGDVDDVRTEFASSGSLSGTWTWHPGSIVAFSHDLGTVGSEHNVTFVVGYVREAAANYMGNSRADYWRGTTPDINSGCVHMLDEFPTADAEARIFDAELASMAKEVAGINYSDILALSARQAFGSMDITIPLDSLDTNDVMAFVKEISSDGNVNTIDVIVPLAPILYVLAPEYICLLLEPVIQYLASDGWPHNSTVHDIGSYYPNATGHNNGTAEQMPVKECGNIILLAFLYQLASGNTSWVGQYSSLFQLYADYSVVNGLFPTRQLSSDDGAGPVANQTGLAIKAAIALSAYGQMTGQSNYSDKGLDFANTIYNGTMGTDPNRTHVSLTQGNNYSWGLEYNLYIDVLLKLNTFQADAYSMQTEFYSGVRMQDGVALDSSVDWGKTDWMHFAAATAMAPGFGNQNVRDMFINDVHAFMTNGQNDVPFSDDFFVENNGSDVAGAYNAYHARPVVGGHFAVLALNGPNQIQSRLGQTKKTSANWVAKLLARFLHSFI